MTASKSGPRRSSLRLASESGPRVRNDAVPRYAVSVLFGSGVEEWRRGWSAAEATMPDREAVVAAGDLTRSAAGARSGSTQVLPDRDLAYTHVGSPTDVDQVVEAVASFFAGADAAETIVLVDDLAPLVSAVGVDEAAELVDRLVTLTGESGAGVRVGCSLTPETAVAAGPVAAAVDEVAGDVAVSRGDLARLREEDPTTFGYVRRHWREARRGIEACDRNYPQSKQVHACVEAGETTPRTMGATLSGLVALGVIDTWSETVGSTRYDLTAYDPVRMATVALAADGIE